MFPVAHLAACEVQVGADDDGSLAGMQIFMEILLAHDLVECDISRFIEFELKEVNPIAADGDRVDAPVRGLRLSLDVNPQQKEDKEDNRLIVFLLGKLNPVGNFFSRMISSRS